MRTISRLSFLLVLAVAARAGQDTASLSGVVRDQTGVVLPDATVTVTQVESRQVRELVTDNTGRYLAAGLAPGTYDVRAERAGFKPAAETGVQLRAGKSHVVNLMLQAAGAAGQGAITGDRGVNGTPLSGFRLGQVEVGARAFLKRPPRRERGKFEEYRDIPPGLFLQNFHLQFESKNENYAAEFQARDAGENDQNFVLQVSNVGRFHSRFEWDGTPHVFTNTGRSLYHQTSPGVLELDDKMQAAVQAAPTGAAKGALLKQFLAGAAGIDLRSRWDVVRFRFRHTPTPDWDFGYEYSRTRKEGDRPIGALTGFSNEVPEPIEHTIQDLLMTAGRAKERWQIQFGYNLSLFENDVDTLVWDSPLQLQDTPDGPGRGRFDLAPNNSAHTASISAAVNLPGRSRLTGAASYGLRFQDDRFIPHTINSTLSNPDLALPAASLHGEVHTRAVKVLFTSRPQRHSSVKAYYRLYDFDDRTPNLTFPALVDTDFTVRTGPSATVTSSRFSYTRQTAGAEAAWALAMPLSLKLGYEWERWDRDARQRAVPVSDEHTPKVSLDYTPADWLLLRASYAKSWRRISAYNPFAHLASAVIPAEFARLVPDGTSQSPLLRQYDIADRDRDRVDFLSQFTFLETLTFTPTLSFRNDAYKNSPFGLQKNRSWAGGGDISWSTREGALAFFASYMRELFSARQRTRHQPEFTPRIDNPTYDWVGRNKDFVNTCGAGLDASLIPDRLDFRLAWNYSRATGRMLAFNPIPPSGGIIPAWDADARAMDFPDRKDAFHSVEASLRYRFKKGWFARVSYFYENFRFSDFRTDNMQLYMGDVDRLLAQRAAYLGAQVRPYTSRMLAFSYGYRF